MVELLNDYLNEVKVIFDLRNPRPVPARLSVNGSGNDKIMLYDGFFVKGRSGYAPAFYIRGDADIKVGMGDKIIKVPTGDNAFTNIPSEFLGYIMNDISDVKVSIKTVKLPLLAKVYSFLLKVAPEFRKSYDADFLGVCPCFPDVIIRTVDVQKVHVGDKVVELLELNTGEFVYQVESKKLIIFNDRPDERSIKIATVMSRFTKSNIVEVDLTDTPVSIKVDDIDTYRLAEKTDDGILLVNEEADKLLFNVEGITLIYAKVSKSNVDKLMKYAYFKHVSKAGDVYRFDNYNGGRVVIINTDKEPSVRLMNYAINSLDELKYTSTWVKGVKEEVKRVFTQRIPTAVAGFMRRFVPDEAKINSRKINFEDADELDF